MSTIWAFDHIENTHTLNRGKDCVKKFCEFLREHMKNIIDFERNVLPLTHKNTKVCYICGKTILKNLSKNINYRNVRD